MLRGVAFAVLVLGGVVEAQNDCSSIRFATALSTPLHARGTGGLDVISALGRKPDGSLTRYEFQTRRAVWPINVASMSVTPGFDQSLFNCYGFGRRTLSPPPGAIQFVRNTLGLSARNGVGADLAGGGSYTLMLTYDRLRRDQLVVLVFDADGSLRSSNSYSVGQNPSFISIADFNGDGQPDAAVLNFGPPAQGGTGSISILLGSGNGTLRAAINTNLAFQPSAFTAWDFNGDGKVDIAAASFNDRVVLLSGNGDGTFRAPVQLTNVGANAMAVADFNGDARPDLVIAQSNSKIAWLRGAADGSFGAPVETQLAFTPFRLVAGDFNKDGRNDVAVVDRLTNTVRVLLGNGAGGFTPRSAYLAGYLPESLMATDFDGDGNLDVIVGTGDPNVLSGNDEVGALTVLFGRGDGSFLGAPVYEIGSTVNNIVVADFNGDGRPDVASGSLSKGLSILLGKGADQFDSVATPVPPGQFGQAVPAGSVAAADFNRDSRVDVAATNESANMVSVFNGNGNGTFVAAVNYPVGSGPRYVATGDLNGDGRPDLVTANSPSNNQTSNGTVSILVATASGFQAAANIAAGLRPFQVKIADLNNDNRPDLVVVNNGTIGVQDVAGGITVHLGNGDGTFRAPVAYPAGLHPTHVTIADLNGDGRPDLVVSTEITLFNWGVSIYLGRGDGTFSAPSSFVTDFGSSESAAVDFDGDRKIDLVVTHCCGETDLMVFPGNGDGTFKAGVHFAPGSSPVAVVAQDINGDGKPDLLVALGLGEPGLLTIFMNASTAASALTAVSSASSVVGPVAPDSLISAYGAKLATLTHAADSLPWATMLGGTQVTVRDALGAERGALISFVSPGQVNFVLPPATAAGTATITIVAGDGTVSTGTVQVNAFAPGVFTLNPNALAAALLLRIRADGSRTTEQVAQLQGSALVPKPIDLGPDTDQVFLLLFGTGVRGGGAQTRLEVGGESLPVAYAGTQGEFPGLDQVNAPLSRNLRGKGQVDVKLTIGNVSANVTRLTFQ